MFDPTIYENLKVVIEGELYDRDSDGEITIVNREDLVNLATMSRSYSISFTLKNKLQSYTATVKLEVTANDLYREILETNHQLGCQLELFIQGPIKDIDKTPALIEDQLSKNWHNRPTIEQQIHFNYNNKTQLKKYDLKIKLIFNRKINEDQIADFSDVITHLINSLDIVAKIETNS